MPPEITNLVNEWGLRDFGVWGAMLAAAIYYHKPILAALTSIRRDPVIDALLASSNAQTEQFRANNGLFTQVVTLLSSMDASLKAICVQTDGQAEALHELLSVQRHVLTETKVAAEIARARK